MSDTSHGFLASYDYLDSTVDVIAGLRRAGFKEIRVYTPYPEHHIEAALGYGQSPVRVFTLVGGLTGTATGLALTSWTSVDWALVVGGKPQVSIPPYLVIAFELTILFGALATVIGLFINARLPDFKPSMIYDPEFSAGRYGVYVVVPAVRADEARRVLEKHEPVEVREGAEADHV